MTIEKRPFGKTGHMSSAVIFGAAALKAADQATSDGVLDLLLEYGVNHIDTAPRYGDAELRIGPWMDRHRKDFFLATKTGERDYEGAKAEIHRSLDRLRTDHIDLLQLHALVYPDECRQALGEGGALDAVIEAREQGLIKYIGVTGHGWTVAAMHQQSLEKFDFDSVLMPWNWFAANHQLYNPDYQTTLAICKERNIAVQTIKGIARGPWAAGVKPNRETWYEPLEGEDSIRKSVHWVLGHPDIFLNSAGDVGLLPSVLKAADQFTEKPDDKEMLALCEREGLASLFGI